MSKLSDKVSFLRGLAEGMKIDQDSNEGKLLGQIIAVLGDFSKKIDELDDGFEELSDYVECIDDDLEALEVRADEDDEDDEDDDDDDIHFELDDEDFDDEDEEEGDDGCDCECCDCGCGDEDDEDAMMYSGCICSECGGMFSVDVNLDDDQLFVCPHCGKNVKAVRMNCTNVPVAETVSKDEDKE